MKKLIIFLLLNTISIVVFASPADPTMRKKIQPNGDTIFVSLQGDEYGSWYEDNKGNIIALNSTKYWVYVNVENGQEILTNQIVSQISTPVSINRDSVFKFVAQKHANNYIEEMESSEDQINSRSTTGKNAPLPTTGIQKILTVLVQFEDVKFQNQTGIRNSINNMMNQVNYRHIGQTEITGSVRDFYLESSYNQLDVRTTVIGPYTVSHNRAHYGAKTNSKNDTDRRELAREVMEMIVDDIDVSQFDNNNDGWVECIHILYAGNGNDEDTLNYSDAIWPHKGSLSGSVSADGVKMSSYIMTPEKYGNYYRGIGTICHELGHILGAPDFYDTNYNTDGDFKGTGNWDLMANGSWNSYIETIKAMNPAHPNPYIKTEIFGWTSALELLGNNRLYSIPPSEKYNAIYKLSTSTQGEYYLLENRQNVCLPGTGLLIYHVSANINDFIPNNEVNITHQQNLYIVDANNHIEKPTGLGSYGIIDSTTTTFRNTYSRNIYFTSTSLPSNNAWNGTPTQNKDICFITENNHGIKFVLNPEIEGPDVLCDSATYSLKHVPANATIEWSYVRTAAISPSDVPLYIGSGQGTKSISYKRGVSLIGSNIDDPIIDPDIPIVPVPTALELQEIPYSGFVDIKVTITFNGQIKSLTKTIYMPEKVEMNTLNFGTLNKWYTGVTKTITLKSPTATELMNDIHWYIELPGESAYYSYGSSVTVTPKNKGTAIFTATYVNGCNDEYMSYTKNYEISTFPGMTYTNPASGSVEICIKNGDAPEESGMRTMSINNQSTPYMGSYRVELWHDIYGKVREMNVPENNPTVTMNLEGLNSGVYVMRLIIDNQVVEASQLIVK